MKFVIDFDLKDNTHCKGIQVMKAMEGTTCSPWIKLTRYLGDENDIPKVAEIFCHKK